MKTINAAKAAAGSGRAAMRGRRGRPPGKDYPMRRTMLLSEADFAGLERLAAFWDCSQSAVVRRLVRDRTRRLKRVLWSEEGR